MGNLQRALSFYVPFSVRANTPTGKKQVVLQSPDIGTRWGKPSSFEFSAQERPPRGGTSIDIRETGEPTHRTNIFDVDCEIQREEKTFLGPGGESEDVTALVPTDIYWTKKINLNRTFTGRQLTRVYEYTLSKVTAPGTGAE